MYRYTEKNFFYSSYKKILFLNFFLNFFCNKKMSMNFETRLNGRQRELPFEAFYKGRTFRGTVNVNEALEALKGHKWP